jgi:hypothetical protein
VAGYAENGKWQMVDGREFLSHLPSTIYHPYLL